MELVIKRPGRDHSHPSTAKIKNSKVIHLLFHTSLWFHTQIITQRDNFAFVLKEQNSSDGLVQDSGKSGDFVNTVMNLVFHENVKHVLIQQATINLTRRTHIHVCSHTLNAISRPVAGGYDATVSPDVRKSLIPRKLLACPFFFFLHERKKYALVKSHITWVRASMLIHKILPPAYPSFIVSVYNTLFISHHDCVKLRGQNVAYLEAIAGSLYRTQRL
jgi:hypothetical protein